MAAAYWKLPTRRWLLATRASTAPGSMRLASHRAAGADHGQRACGRDAQRMHGLAHDVLAQHGADDRQAVGAAASERRRARSPSGAHRRGGRSASVDLTEKESATVAQTRRDTRRTGARRRPAPREWHRPAPASPVRMRTPSWPRRNAGSRPSSVANGSLSTRIRASGNLVRSPRDGQLRKVAREVIARVTADSSATLISTRIPAVAYTSAAGGVSSMTVGPGSRG